MKRVSPYRAAIASRNALREQIEANEREHRVRMAKIRAVLAEQDRLIAIAESGFSIDQFQVAQHFVSIEWGGRSYDSRTGKKTGTRRDTAEVHGCFRAVIDEFRAGPSFILHSYYGVKQYDGWNSQSHNDEYGWGPKHGSIWFRIGMPDRMRNEIRAGRVLTDDETIAIVAWLAAVEANPLLLDAGVKP